MHQLHCLSPHPSPIYPIINPPLYLLLSCLQMGASSLRIFLRFLDMITIAVPPALPACLTISTVFSIGRLRKKDIYVTSPDRIAMAGQLDVVCFDKTGVPVCTEYMDRVSFRC